MPKITLSKNVRKSLYWVALAALVVAGMVGLVSPEDSVLAAERAGSILDLFTGMGDKVIAAVGIIVALRNLTADETPDTVGELPADELTM